MKYFILTLIAIMFLPVVAHSLTDLPVDNGVVTSGVGWRLDPFGSGRLVFHRGIDIAVPVGTPVHNTHEGRVVFAGIRRGYGNTVIIEHMNGDRTLYGHNSAVQVTIGDIVDKGTIIAFSGNTGRSTGPHVHYEQLPGGKPVTLHDEPDDASILQIEIRNERHLLDQQMDDSVNSILKRLNRSRISGQGG